MAIVAAGVNDYFNLQLKPNFIADTLAELDAALATYVGDYVEVIDQANKIYFIEDDESDGPTRLEAYAFANWRAIDPADVGSIRFYDASGLVTNVGVYTEIKANDASGETTIYPTDDGLVSGTSIFTSILQASAIAILDQADSGEVPLMGVRTATVSAVVFHVVEARTHTELPGRNINPLKFHDNTSVNIQANVYGILDAAFQ